MKIMSVSLIDGHIDPDTNCMSLVEKIVIERNKEIDNAILGTIVNIANENGISVTLNEKAIVNVLKKQIPKKPKVIFDEYSYFECGNCGEAIYCSDELKTHKYCLNCGQALDWSDTE